MENADLCVYPVPQRNRGGFAGSRVSLCSQAKPLSIATVFSAGNSVPPSGGGGDR